MNPGKPEQRKVNRSRASSATGGGDRRAREWDTLQAELPAGMTIDRRIFRQADFIRVAVENVFRALRDGGLLVVIIVVVFLANARASAITLTAIPLSLAAAVLAGVEGRQSTRRA